MVLLVECLFSATERIHEGGRAATAPVEVFAHRHALVQLQVIGMQNMLTPFKMAEALVGIARIGVRHTRWRRG